MNVDQVLDYLDKQETAIQGLIDQLDEIQATFNAQFDDFKAWHDAELDRLTEEVFDGLGSDPAKRSNAISPELRRAIEDRLPAEREQIDERRQKVRGEYLPQRRKAADDLLNTAQAELAELRSLNPQLDEREEALKGQKAGLEARLAELNAEIRQQSRGLGVALHFIAITRADRERQRVIGKLEVVNDSLLEIRREWEGERKKVEGQQVRYQGRWQLESVAVARLQSELDQLEDDERRQDLALRRATRGVLDDLKQPTPASDEALDARLREMVELNIQTDAYHEGLASVGGLIGLAGGIRSGLEAIAQSIEGLKREQRMHKEHLRPLSFSLPAGVQSFHKQWPALAQQFTDEKTVGTHPAEFAATVEPLLEGPLSQANVEAMFSALSAMIKQATSRW